MNKRSATHVKVNIFCVIISIMSTFTSTCSLMNLSYFYEVQVEVTLEEEDRQVEGEEEEKKRFGEASCMVWSIM
jgi:hypothetical protein